MSGNVRWPWWDDEETHDPDYRIPELVEEDNPIVAVLLGPDEEPLVIWRERNTLPFGFQ